MVNTLWTNIFSRKKKETGDPRKILGEIPIFAGLSNSDIREIERIVHVRNYSPGEYVFEEGVVGAGMFVIAQGSVDILLESHKEIGKPKRIAALKKGDFFGELSLLDSDWRSAAAKTTETSVLIGFFRPDLLDLIERNPKLGSKVLMNIAQIIGERLRVTNARLMGDIPDETAYFDVPPAKTEAAYPDKKEESDDEA